MLSERLYLCFGFPDGDLERDRPWRVHDPAKRKGRWRKRLDVSSRESLWPASGTVVMSAACAGESHLALEKWAHPPSFYYSTAIACDRPSHKQLACHVFAYCSETH